MSDSHTTTVTVHDRKGSKERLSQLMMNANNNNNNTTNTIFSTSTNSNTIPQLMTQPPLWSSQQKYNFASKEGFLSDFYQVYKSPVAQGEQQKQSQSSQLQQAQPQYQERGRVFELLKKKSTPKFAFSTYNIDLSKSMNRGGEDTLINNDATAAVTTTTAAHSLHQQNSYLLASSLSQSNTQQQQQQQPLTLYESYIRRKQEEKASSSTKISSKARLHSQLTGGQQLLSSSSSSLMLSQSFSPKKSKHTSLRFSNSISSNNNSSDRYESNGFSHGNGTNNAKSRRKLMQLSFVQTQQQRLSEESALLNSKKVNSTSIGFSNLPQQTMQSLNGSNYHSANVLLSPIRQTSFASSSNSASNMYQTQQGRNTTMLRSSSTTSAIQTTTTTANPFFKQSPRKKISLLELAQSQTTSLDENYASATASQYASANSSNIPISLAPSGDQSMHLKSVNQSMSSNLTAASMTTSSPLDRIPKRTQNRQSTLNYVSTQNPPVLEADQEEDGTSIKGYPPSQLIKPFKVYTASQTSLSYVDNNNNLTGRNSSQASPRYPDTQPLDSSIVKHQQLQQQQQQQQQSPHSRSPHKHLTVSPPLIASPTTSSPQTQSPLLKKQALSSRKLISLESTESYQQQMSSQIQSEDQTGNNQQQQQPNNNCMSESRWKVNNLMTKNQQKKQSIQLDKLPLLKYPVGYSNKLKISQLAAANAAAVAASAAAAAAVAFATASATTLSESMNISPSQIGAIASDDSSSPSLPHSPLLKSSTGPTQLLQQAGNAAPPMIQLHSASPKASPSTGNVVQPQQQTTNPNTFSLTSTILRSPLSIVPEKKSQLNISNASIMLTSQSSSPTKKQERGSPLLSTTFSGSNAIANAAITLIANNNHNNNSSSTFGGRLSLIADMNQSTPSIQPFNRSSSLLIRQGSMSKSTLTIPSRTPTSQTNSSSNNKSRSFADAFKNRLNSVSLKLIDSSEPIARQQSMNEIRSLSEISDSDNNNNSKQQRQEAEIQGDDTKLGVLTEVMRNHLRDEMKADSELRNLVSNNNKGDFVSQITIFFQLCVGNVDYAFVKDQLSVMQINRTLFAKVLSVIMQKLKQLGMTDAYIDRFKVSYAENMERLLPKSILEKVGGMPNLRRIVTRCLEIFYLEHSVIDQFTPQSVEHILNCVVSFVNNNRESIRSAFEELSYKQWFSSDWVFLFKKTAFHAMLEGKIELELTFKFIEQFESYRCFLFEPRVGFGSQTSDEFSDSITLESLVGKFHDNTEISGFFLDPSDENSREFFKLFFAALYGYKNLNDLVAYLKKHLKIAANRKFFENLKELLKKCVPELTAQHRLALVEFEFKCFVLMCKLDVFSSNVFMKFLANLDVELTQITQEITHTLKTAHLKVSDSDILACVPLLKDILTFAFQTNYEIYNVGDLAAAVDLAHLNSHALPILGYILKTYFEKKNDLLPAAREIILECIKIVFSAI